MNFISMADLSPEDILDILDKAEDMKGKRKQGVDLLRNKSLVMLFEKPSTRTRASFEVAMTELGGHAICLNWQEIQLGRGESLEDTARVLSSYVNGIMIRAEHSKVLKMAKSSSVPVINGLTELEHPCQSLADLLTIREFKGGFSGLKFGWIGDGNNVCNSSILAGALVGMKVVVACPKGYEPNADILEKSRILGGNTKITHDVREAAKNADILYTDVWVSMGDEAQKKKRMLDFKGFQINADVVKMAKDDVIVMHCLPAHRGAEIAPEIIDDPHSVIFAQAENRLHAQKALLVRLLG
ncbi:MAG: ornithine carbamoyltransferase [Methanocellales archaeon]|nr:ornithine carbamoyltransferase [Methanocellales archaeon]MDD3291730.1 ornithine carbamoyltransferase [Methanocellales archaeon]MDD5235080.1 ornithine carbamoyltransferase [Methanocellales archaeon]MDD5485218.1 ornithine carbamoyltransferase [Methanocellales archaeon]